MFDRFFMDHPNSVGESYFEHMGQALSFAAVMLLAGMALVVHALVPGLFVTTGRRAILSLHDRMVGHRRRGSTASPLLDYVI